MISLYTLHSTPTDGEFIIQKLDTDYTCESVYACTLTACACPQGHKPVCRHRTMLPMFLKHGHIGDGWFLEWNTRMWRRPVGDLADVGKTHEQSPWVQRGPGMAEIDHGNLLADETVMGTSRLVVATDKSAWNDKNVKTTIAEAQVHSTSAGAGEASSPPLPSPGAASEPSPEVLPPPSPPEGSAAPSAEAAPASPVVTGAIVVKRRKIS